MSERRIWKFAFSVTDSFELEMPRGSQIIHVGYQANVMTGCAWAVVNPDADKVRRRFRVIGTGHPILDCDTLRHVGTWLADPFVWHLFEVVE